MGRSGELSFRLIEGRFSGVIMRSDCGTLRAEGDGGGGSNAPSNHVVIGTGMLPFFA
jgi:hypothetical protein